MENPIIAQALELVATAAAKVEIESHINLVVRGLPGTDPYDMDETGSMEEFCEDCIQNAIDKEHEDFFARRTIELGKLHEVIMRGRYTYSTWKREKDGKLSHRVTKQSNKQILTAKQVKAHERHLGKKFPINAIISSKSYDIRCNQEEGFKSCDSCGKLFAYNLLLNDQELEHWLNPDIEIDTTDPRQAYELQEILGYWELNPDHELFNSVLTLAEKVIKSAETKSTQP